MSDGVSGSGDKRVGEGKGWIADVSRFASVVKRLELSVSALLGAGHVITCPRYAHHFSEGLSPEKAHRSERLRERDPQDVDLDLEGAIVFVTGRWCRV